MRSQLWFFGTFLILPLASLRAQEVEWAPEANMDHQLFPSLIIATALGAGLTVLLGSGLMALVFISNSSGHDDAASQTRREEDSK
jgi:hypothetical protein